LLGSIKPATTTSSESESASEFPLPHYALHYIFCFLSKWVTSSSHLSPSIAVSLLLFLTLQKDLLACHVVAKKWRTVATDAGFAWLNVLALPLFETSSPPRSEPLPSINHFPTTFPSPFSVPFPPLFIQLSHLAFLLPLPLQ
jgi:hypothetical protein